MKIIISFMLCLAVNFCSASDYYVDAKKGNDKSGDGSLKNPWATIQKAADEMGEGDVCLIRDGIYREEVLPQNGQTFKAYQDEEVIVTGLDIIENWNPDNSKIDTHQFDSKVLQLFYNGKRMNKARFPDEDGKMRENNDWTDIQIYPLSFQGTGKVKIVFPKMENKPKNFWVGGHFYGNGTGRIIASDSNFVIIDRCSYRLKEAHSLIRNGNTSWIGREGKGYIIHHLNALTSPKEWHWQEGSLYFKAPENTGNEKRLIEARTRIYVFDLSGRENVTIEGLNIKAGSVLLKDASNCIIENCEIRYPAPWGNHYYVNGHDHGGYEDGTAGIYVTGAKNKIKSCYIGHSWGCCIFLGGQFNTVENCILEDANWQRRATCAILAPGDDNKILHNTIRNTIGPGIKGGCRDQGYGDTIQRTDIMYNDIRNSCNLTPDQGAIYINVGDGIDRSIHCTIAYNVIGKVQAPVHPKSFGIYIDDGTDFVSIHHNVINGGGIFVAIFLHAAGHVQENIEVYNNTCWGYTEAAVYSVYRPTGSSKFIYTRNNIAEKDGFMGTAANHNRANISADQFVDVNALDFRIKNSDSPLIDAGAIIEGFTNDYIGKAPDLGAYEYGVEAWKAGSTLNVPEEL